MPAGNMPADEVNIDVSLVSRLVAAQFPQWSGLPITPVAFDGWDNQTFRFGEEMTVRLPSAAGYAAQVEKEQRWLPRLGPLLSLPIPVPLAMGVPAGEYPWHWSVYRWLDGEIATIAPNRRSAPIRDHSGLVPHRFATDRSRRWTATWAAQLFPRRAADRL